MPEWSTACPDWAERLVGRKSIIPAPIYPEEAEKALSIFKQLQVVDLGMTAWDDDIGDEGGYRAPTFGECSEQWVFDFVAAIFGAYDEKTGDQLIREFYLLISKKNTKSTIAAGIMLTAVMMCWRNEEEHLILAPTKEVADNSFKAAAAMVRADEELKAIFHVQDHIRTITHLNTRASLKVVAADTETVSGKKSGRVLVDEHWLFGKKASADAMFMEATGGLVSRPEGWVIYLTTQSDEPPAGVFKEKLNYYRDLRDGKIVDPKRLGVLYEFPPAMLASKEYEDPANFYITNPNLGKSVSSEWLVDELRVQKAKQDGSFQKFLAKHLNVEIGLNLRADRWAGADYWEAAARKGGLSLEYLLERSEVVVVGIDGGGLDDLLGMSVMGRDHETKHWLHWAHAWAHPSVLERRKSEAPRFRDFEADGDLTMVKAIGEDVEDVAQIVMRCEKTGLLDSVGVDAVGITDILDALIAEKFEEKRITAVPQGYKLAGVIKTAERQLAAGTFVHGGTRLMNYCVSNAKVEVSRNSILITKQSAGTAKIDPLMATFSCAALLGMNPKPRKKKYQLLFAGV